MEAAIKYIAILAFILVFIYIYSYKKPKKQPSDSYTEDYDTILSYIQKANRVDTLYTYLKMIDRFEEKHSDYEFVKVDAKILTKQLIEKADELLLNLKLRSAYLN